MKLNREQIIKALENCLTTEYGVSCKGCPLSYEDKWRMDCLEILMNSAFSLIKELTDDNEAQSETIANLIETIKSIQADTVREMAERLHIMVDTMECKGDVLFNSVIDDIRPFLKMQIDHHAKEMLEG